jgi:acylglycerol lipase
MNILARVTIVGFIALHFCVQAADSELGYTFEERMIENREGMQLHTTYMRPHNALPSEPVILWLHGLGQHTLRDKAVMEYMARHGIASVGFDARGHGKSEGYRGYVESKDVWVADLEDVYAYYKSVLGSTIILVGHSAGTFIIMRYIQQHERSIPVTAAILSAPVLDVNKEKYTWYKYAVAGPVAYLFPYLNIPHEKSDKDALLFTKDQAMIEADKQDPYVLMHANIHTLVMIFWTFAEYFDNSQRMNVPTHIFTAGDEFMIDNEATERFYTHLPDELEKSYKKFEGMRHTLFRDVERDQVFDRMIEIIKKYTV